MTGYAMTSVVERYALVREDYPAKPSSRIGALLVDAGKLTANDAHAVLRYQNAHDVPFGEAAIGLGLVSEADIQAVLSKQFDYAYLEKGASSILPEVVAAYEPFSARVEQLRALRSQLSLRCFQGSGGGAKCFVVASVGRADGRSYLAANLAVVFSQLGERTLLIDGDLRHPRQHTLFGLEQRQGLSTCLSGRGNLSSVQRISGLVDLSVLVAGPVPPNPQELLSRSAFSTLLATTRKDYEVVIVDTSAAELGADAVALAATATHALLVARRDHTRVLRVRAVTDQINACGGRVVGVVFNSH